MTRYCSFTKRQLLDMLKDHSMDDTVLFQVKCGKQVMYAEGYDIVPHIGSGGPVEIQLCIDS